MIKYIFIFASFLFMMNFSLIPKTDITSINKNFDIEVIDITTNGCIDMFGDDDKQQATLLPDGSYYCNGECNDESTCCSIIEEED